MIMSYGGDVSKSDGDDVDYCGGGGAATTVEYRYWNDPSTLIDLELSYHLMGRMLYGSGAGLCWIDVVLGKDRPINTDAFF